MTRIAVVVVKRRGEEPLVLDAMRDWTQAVHVANVMHRGRLPGETVHIRVRLGWKGTGFTWGTLLSFGWVRDRWKREAIFHLRVVNEDESVNMMSFTRWSPRMRLHITRRTGMPMKRAEVTIFDPLQTKQEILV